MNATGNARTSREHFARGVERNYGLHQSLCRETSPGKRCTAVPHARFAPGL